MTQSGSLIDPDYSTTTEKVIACLTGFGLACAAFTGSLVFLLPVIGHYATAFGLPDAITIALLMTTLFGTTVVAGIAGVSLQANHFASRRERNAKAAGF